MAERKIGGNDGTGSRTLLRDTRKCSNQWENMGSPGREAVCTSNLYPGACAIHAMSGLVQSLEPQNCSKKERVSASKPTIHMLIRGTSLPPHSVLDR